MSKKIVFPGSFDPLTRGHVDLIARASRLFDEVIVGIFTNTNKKSWFTPAEKLSLTTAALAHLPNVKVVLADHELTVRSAKAMGAVAILRGVRSVKDYEYERDIASMNAHLEPEIETVILFTNPQLSFVSSSLLKEVLTFGGEVSAFLPDNVWTALKEKGAAYEK